MIYKYKNRIRNSFVCLITHNPFIIIKKSSLICLVEKHVEDSANKKDKKKWKKEINL